MLLIRKIFKINATRCHIFRLKCTKFDFGCLAAKAASPCACAGLAYTAYRLHVRPLSVTRVRLCGAVYIKCWALPFTPFWLRHWQWRFRLKKFRTFLTDNIPTHAPRITRSRDHRLIQRYSGQHSSRHNETETGKTRRGKRAAGFACGFFFLTKILSTRFWKFYWQTVRSVFFRDLPTWIEHRRQPWERWGDAPPPEKK